MKTNDKNNMEVYIPLLAFSFFYSVAVFHILVRFYKWQLSRDSESE